MSEESNCRDLALSEDSFDVFLQYQYSEQELEEVLRRDCVQVINQRFAVAHSYTTQINNLEFNFLLPKCYGLMDSASMEDIGVLRLRRQIFPNLTGSGVLVGFVDTGIDYTSPLFKNADNTSRILSIWDQSIQTGAVPAGYIYGSEYSNEDINRALASENPLEVVPSVDVEGHGSAMAAIAAGGIDRENDFTGAAPLTSIVMVKLKQAKRVIRDYFLIPEGVPCYQENDILLGVKYLLNFAEQVQMPIIICLGLGTNQGDHEGTGVLDEYLNTFSVQRGVGLITSAGNEGNSSGHYRGGNNSRSENGESRLGSLFGRSYEDVQIRVAPLERGFFVEILTGVPNLYSVAIISPSGEYINTYSGNRDSVNTVRFIFEQTTVTTYYSVSEGRSGDPLIMLRFEAPAPGIWTLRVYDERNFGGGFDAWLPIQNFRSEGTYFLGSNPYTTLCGPGNAMGPITVSTYDHLNGSIWIDSSRGFTRSGRISPEIAGPGVNINIPGFGTRSGSSIAAAHAAGAAALLMEWGIVMENRPNMGTVEIKKFFITGARRKDIPYPNREWGYGALDIYNTFDSMRGTRA